MILRHGSPVRHPEDRSCLYSSVVSEEEFLSRRTQDRSIMFLELPSMKSSGCLALASSMSAKAFSRNVPSNSPLSSYLFVRVVAFIVTIGVASKITQAESRLWFNSRADKPHQSLSRPQTECSCMHPSHSAPNMTLATAGFIKGKETSMTGAYRYSQSSRGNCIG